MTHAYNDLTFSTALRMLKDHKQVYRMGWDSYQWLTLIHPGNATHMGYDMQPCIGIKTVGGKMQPGWVPSQSDMLAEDWIEWL